MVKIGFDQILIHTFQLLRYAESELCYSQIHDWSRQLENAMLFNLTNSGDKKVTLIFYNLFIHPYTFHHFLP